MPSNVRNFWIAVQVDGKSTPIATGPSTKDGGFQLEIKQRHKGYVQSVIDITGYLNDDGSLYLNVRKSDDVQELNDDGNDHPVRSALEDGFRITSER